VAILSFESRTPAPYVARLCPREKFDRIEIFTDVYAIGCPLGHAPLPTRGQITSKKKVVRAETFWMMNAPTIYGNSGGGIFLADSGELIGVSSMICGYSQLISIPVPHLGVFLPLSRVYDWLDTQGLWHVYRPEVPPQAGRLYRQLIRSLASGAVGKTIE
jgi:S1-C subfamily serine protease